MFVTHETSSLLNTSCNIINNAQFKQKNTRKFMTRQRKHVANVERTNRALEEQLCHTSPLGPTFREGTPFDCGTPAAIL